jgi:hypothetical protein
VGLKKLKSQGKAAEVTVNSKKKISYDFCLDFVKEFVLSSVVLENIIEKVYCTQKRSLCQILLKLYGWLIHYPLSNPRPSHAFYLTSIPFCLSGFTLTVFLFFAWIVERMHKQGAKVL